MIRSLLPTFLKFVLLIVLFLTINPTTSIAQITIISEDNPINNIKDVGIAGHLSDSMGFTGPGGVGDTSGTGHLTLWLDANSIDQVDGTNLSTWTDKSGYGNTANAPSGNEPIFLSGKLNGYPLVRFTAANSDYLRVADDPSIRPADISLFVVGTHTIPNTANAPFVIKTGSWDWSNGYGIAMNSDNNVHRAFVTHWFANSVIAPHPASIYEIMTMIYDKTKVILYNDETTQGADDFTTNINQSTNYLYLGISPDGSGVGPATGVRNPLNGDIVEVIIIKLSVNAAQRIIIHNYLGAKYGLSLGVNDVYDEDRAANGDYDHDVAGIGRVDATNEHTDAQGSGRVRILNPTDLNDDEFMMWGHDSGLELPLDTSDVPAPVIVRLARTWRVSEVNAAGTAVDVGSVDMRFLLNKLGPITASHLRLLVDTDNDGLFADETPIAGAVDLGGNVYEWAGVSELANNTRFTLGTTNPIITPLPIDFISFDAIKNDDKIDLKWVTASEINNDFFTLERSANVSSWEEINTIDGSGNSENEIEYIEYDFEPLTGISYYRLKQTDFDGDFSYSKIVSINFDSNKSFDILNIYPNPIIVGETLKIGLKSNFESNFILVLRDMMGREFYSKVIINKEDGSLIAVPIDLDIPAGIYFVSVISQNEIHSQKLMINSSTKY